MYAVEEDDGEEEEDDGEEDEDAEDDIEDQEVPPTFPAPPTAIIACSPHWSRMREVA